MRRFMMNETRRKTMAKLIQPEHLLTKQGEIVAYAAENAALNKTPDAFNLLQRRVNQALCLAPDNPTETTMTVAVRYKPPPLESLDTEPRPPTPERPKTPDGLFRESFEFNGMQEVDMQRHRQMASMANSPYTRAFKRTMKKSASAKL